MGAVSGIIFGIVGIGIPLPGTALAEWQWLHPAGFYTASVVLLGSFGMVLGWIADHLIRRALYDNSEPSSNNILVNRSNCPVPPTNRTIEDLYRDARM